MLVTDFGATETLAEKFINSRAGRTAAKIIQFNYQSLAKRPARGRTGGNWLAWPLPHARSCVVTTNSSKYFFARRIMRNMVRFNCPIKRSPMRFIGDINCAASFYCTTVTPPRGAACAPRTPKYIGEINTLLYHGGILSASPSLSS